MDKKQKALIQQWVIKAKHDFETAGRLIDCEDPINDTGVYHCQQSAEKILKAYLCSQGQVILKVHDLTLLIKECMAIDTSFDSFVDAADILTPYAVVFRYPGDVLEPTDDEAKEALQLAKAMMEFVAVKVNCGV